MDETMRRIEAVLNEKIRPVLRAHGGDIAADRLEDGVLYVRFLGQCAGCPSADLTNETVVEEELVRAGVLPQDYDFEGHRELVGMQPGDVPVTYADASALERDYGFTPSIGIREGLRAFSEWYREYYSDQSEA